MSVDQEREELRTSLIKSITKPKYNDLDDFVNWLNEPRMVGSRMALSIMFRTTEDVWMKVWRLHRLGVITNI